jgi:uncharacterized protein
VTSWDAVCEIVAQLPGTALDEGSDNPAWRVNGKVLVRRNPRLDVDDVAALRAARGEPIAIRADRGEREALLVDDPDTFFITPHWQSSPSVLVWLGTVDVAQLRELVIEAWLARAPKQLIRDWHASQIEAQSPDVFELDTPQGPARVHLHGRADASTALVLGHGAGGSVSAADLRAASDAALADGLTVALVEQPYRFAGRRSSPPVRQLDAAWIAVIAQLRGEQLSGRRLVVGGRSAGARVACRTAEACGAVAVLCLAFPLEPPRRSPDALVRSRLEELDGVQLPTLVVQGERDQFGIPPAAPNRKVVVVAGNHSLSSDLEAVGTAVRDWLAAAVLG